MPCSRQLVPDAFVGRGGVRGGAGARGVRRSGRLMRKVALYEVPFIVDDTHATLGADLGVRTQQLIDADRQGDAV